MQKTALLSAAAALAFSLPAIAQVQNPSLIKGIQALNNNQTQQALAWLEQARKSGEDKHSTVHYYLGNVYKRMHKTEAAIEEFKLAIGLEPSSKAAQMAKMDLQRLQPKAAAALVNADKAKLMADAVNKLPFPALPPLPGSSEDHPTLFEIQRWTAELRSRYLSQAQDRVPRAEKQLFDAKQLLSKAQDAASAFVPPRKDKSEDDATYQQRARAYRNRTASMLQPYQDYVSRCDQQLKDCKTIFSTCQIAFRNVNGYMQVNK